MTVCIIQIRFRFNLGRILFGVQGKLYNVGIFIMNEIMTAIMRSNKLSLTNLYFNILGPVVRKPDNFIHRIVIFSTVVKTHKKL